MGRHLSYDRISGRRILGQPSRGFRLKARPRLCIQRRLRAKLFYLIRTCLCKWKLALHNHFSKLLMIIKKSGNRRSGIGGKCNTTDNTSGSTSTMRSYNRLNSFYSEAISDCLEFIKLSSAVPPTYHHEINAAVDGKPAY